jgi:hypothetical protein
MMDKTEDESEEEEEEEASLGIMEKRSSAQAWYHRRQVSY